MGIWELDIKVAKDGAKETATFYPEVAMSMGDDDVRVDLKGYSTDKIANMSGSTDKRSYDEHCVSSFSKVEGHGVSTAAQWPEHHGHEAGRRKGSKERGSLSGSLPGMSSNMTRAMRSGIRASPRASERQTGDLPPSLPTSLVIAP